MKYYHDLYNKVSRMLSRMSLKRKTLALVTFFGMAIAMTAILQFFACQCTLAPPAVMYYMKAAAVSYPEEPPLGWTRVDFKARVVLSLTTMPENVQTLPETLDSLLKQTFKADAIYVTLPEKNARTGEKYPNPEWEDFYAGSTPEITIVKPKKDYGPLCKLAGALMKEPDPNTVIITVDDDKIYSESMVAKLVWHTHNDPKKAFGPCGFSFLPMFKPRGIAPIYAMWRLRGKGLYTDELQACCGNLYRRGFFDMKEGEKGSYGGLLDPPKACFTTDDLWIAGNLAMSKIPRVLIGGVGGDTLGGWGGKDLRGWDPLTPSWKLNQGAASNTLSNMNSKAGIDVGCVEAVEQRFGQKWHRVRDYVVDAQNEVTNL